MSIKEFGRQHSLDTILALMQAAMAEAEESSDEVANSLLRKELTIDEFLKVIFLSLVVLNSHF